MCALCGRYGTKPIKNEALLKQALAHAATLLHLAHSDTQEKHILEFIDKVSMEESPYEPDKDAEWEVANKCR